MVGLYGSQRIDLGQAIYLAIPMVLGDFEWSFIEPDKEQYMECTFSTRYVGLVVQWKEINTAKGRH